MASCIQIKVAILCSNANGSPEFVWRTVTVYQEQYDAGAHYDRAMAMAEANGYKTPMVAFDENDDAARQLENMMKFLTEK